VDQPPDTVADRPRPGNLADTGRAVGEDPFELVLDGGLDVI
jgi:hypothetical protein